MGNAMVSSKRSTSMTRTQHVDRIAARATLSAMSAAAFLVLMSVDMIIRIIPSLIVAGTAGAAVVSSVMTVLAYRAAVNRYKRRR